MTSLYVLRRLNKRQKSYIDQVDQVLVVNAADRQRDDHREPSDAQLTERVALITDIDQVLVVDAADRQRDHREPSDAQRVALIRRLATASRSTGIDANELFTEEDFRRIDDLRRLEMDENFTHEDLDEVVDWIVANESNGDFSRDACQFITRIPVATREIPIIRTR